MKLIYFLTCLAFLPTLLLSGYYIQQSREEAVSQKIKKIHQLALSRQNTLETHLDNYIKSMNSLTKSNVIKSFLDGDKENFDRANDLVRQFQEEMWGASHHIFIADTKGHIVLSPYHSSNKKSTHIEHSIATSKYFQGSLNSTQVTDFYGFEESTHYHQLVMTPIKVKGETKGVLISEITIQFFIDLMRKDFDLGETGEIYLVTLNNEKVVHLKKDKITKVKNKLLADAEVDGAKYGETKAENGTEILASYIKSPKFPWYLAVELEKEEMLAPINKVAMYISIAYGVCLVLFLFCLRFIIGLIKNPVTTALDSLETNSQELSFKSHELHKDSVLMSRNASEQSSSLQKTVSAMEEISAMVNKNAQSATSTLEVSEKSNVVASEGLIKVEQLSDTMGLISESNERIKQLAKSIAVIEKKTKIINDIVFQTKLLSINASVEAAKAGEHGKGFAVVAEEVGNLAATSGKASLEISELLTTFVKNVDEVVNLTTNRLESGAKSATECKEVFEEISFNVARVNNLVKEVVTASQEQSDGIEEVSGAVKILDKVISESEVIAKKTLQTSEGLELNSGQLKTTMSRLKTLTKGSERNSEGEVIPMPKGKNNPQHSKAS